jgi:hypothetical protein
VQPFLIQIFYSQKNRVEVNQKRVSSLFDGTKPSVRLSGPGLRSSLLNYSLLTAHYSLLSTKIPLDNLLTVMVTLLVIIARQPVRSASIRFPARPLTQLLPAFSTASKHPRCSRHFTPLASPIPSIAYAHFPSPRGRVSAFFVQPPRLPSSNSVLSAFVTSPSLSAVDSLITPLSATLTEFVQLTENPVTLSLLFATLTRSAQCKSFICHSYKKLPGWGARSKTRLEEPHEEAGTR